MVNMLKKLSKDKIKIKKQDGTMIENIMAHVQPKMIFIHDGSLEIEEGDLIIRTLSNGGIEEYEVIDRGFYEKVHSFDAHYQCKVRKLTAKNYESISQVNNTYNFTGPNARYNNNSTDNSVNVAVTESVILFEEIRKAIQKDIQDSEQQRVILEMVNEMESSKGTPTFKEKYAGFIQALGNHITVITPFLPALSQLL